MKYVCIVGSPQDLTLVQSRAREDSSEGSEVPMRWRGRGGACWGVARAEAWVGGACQTERRTLRQGREGGRVWGKGAWRSREGMALQGLG